MDFTPFDILTATEMDDLVENIESLANGTAFDAGDIPMNSINGITNVIFDFVGSGIVWTGDAYGSTRLASMTAGIVFINGTRVAVNAVTGRTFTASRDTYIDIGVDGVVDYNEVTNNNASPALAASHIRVGIIVTGASNIANVGSVNQGQIDKVLPIASSTPYAVVDSLGNLICPRDPMRKTIGARQIISQVATTGGVITGLSFPVIITSSMVGRRIKVEGIPYAATAASGQYAEIRLFTGASLNATTTQIGSSQFGQISGSGLPASAKGFFTPASAQTIFFTAYLFSSSSTATLYAAAASPSSLQVTLD